MNEFNTYFQLGLKHITDVKAYDHILFILALSIIYKFSDWKKVGILVTAFTIGHSITLVLATLKIIKVNSNFIEFLIPITILITCIFNFFHVIPDRKTRKPQKSYYRYFMALVFGLIHGLGFSNYLRSLLGTEESIIKPLFAFNIGLELGQIIIVSISLIVTSLVINTLNAKPNNWKLAVSGVISGIALFLIKESAYFTEFIK